jgi:ribosomal protein S12 methylthiotransferase accessory factor
MQIEVRYLENLKLEALFDDYKVLTDQPVRYKGDGTAPSPFDYFLASSALCAAYFVKVYCKARDISTEDIRVTQDNIVDPENRYKQTFKIQVELPASLHEKDRDAIVKSIDRCTVKKTIQAAPEFVIEAKDILGTDNDNTLVFKEFLDAGTETKILSKDASLEETIQKMTGLLSDLGIKIEISSWRNPVPHVWSVHIRDADSPICYTNGKGASKQSALCSALGEYIERISNNYFYADYFLGEENNKNSFVHYPKEKWFSIPEDDSLPRDLMDENLLNFYAQDGELRASHLVDTNSGQKEKGICALPYKRWSDQKDVYVPVNLIGNLFVSNGMSAGNTIHEARVQCLSEIFERAIKNKILIEEIALPDVPAEIISKYPSIQEGIQALEERGFPVLVKDASLGGKYPVMCVTLMNPKTGGVFASFGAHPNFEVALERSLTELLQGRSFEGLNDMPPPTFNTFAIQEQNNIIDHFIDSTGVVSWRFFSNKAEHDFVHWNFSGSTEQEFNYLMQIFEDEKREVYIADYKELGAAACRILVPGFSEIYPKEDLIWDNNNRALLFREEILNLHRLNKEELIDLVEKLEESELDNYMPISELIGISFDETSVWGECVIGELKSLIYVALRHFEPAKEYVEQFAAFNDTSFDRRKYFQLLNVMIDIELEADLNFEEYRHNLSRMYGKELLEVCEKSISGEIKFYGLVETNMGFKNLEKHQRLIESYQKLQKKRAEFKL